MSGFITAGSQYNGLESIDLIIRPHTTQLQAEGVSVITTQRAGSIKLTYFGKLQKILMPYSDGWQGGSGSTKKQKTFSLGEFKAEAAYSKQDYIDTILETVTNQMGIAQNDISGTNVHDAELLVFGRGVIADADRVWWLGSTTKKHTTAGTYPNGVAYTYGEADKYYSTIDGVWTSLIADAVAYGSATQDDVRRITISNGAVAEVDTITMTGTSGTANVNIKGKDYLATFATSLTVTCADFVTAHAAALLLRNIVCTSSAATIILTSSIAGVPLGTPTITNASGNLAGSKADTTANTLPADLTTDEAKDTMISMYRNSTQELRGEKRNGTLRYYVSESMFFNYEDTLLSGTTEQARQTLVDGVMRYTLLGIPVITVAWDTFIESDFEGAYPHRAILSTVGNLCKVLASAGDTAETRMWFNPDENQNRQRTQFEFGGGYILPEFITVAY